MNISDDDMTLFQVQLETRTATYSYEVWTRDYDAVDLARTPPIS